MAITEDQRNQLHNAASKSWGREEAATLMEHLPPVGWADVATKRDLEHLEVRIEAKLERALREQANRFIGWMFLMFTVSIGIQGMLVTAVA